MLNIYYADALTDREAFIFDHIDPAKKTILLVPDQFSLQAERDALRMSGQKALLELMVTDFNQLGHKVVHELEGHEPQIIDKYGRHMLLSVLIERMDEELTVFRGRKGRSAFADHMNTMISELKRYEISPDRLGETIDQLKQGSGDPARAAGSFLVLKLEDMLKIYRAYEKAIEGVYRDSEDFISYYADRIPSSEIVRGADVWIYGFDSFTPKNRLVIRKIMETAAEVSVVLTYEEPGRQAAGAAGAQEVPGTPGTASAQGSASMLEAAGAQGAPTDGCGLIRSLTQGDGMGLFRLTEQMMGKLEEDAEQIGMEHRRQRIDPENYRRESIWHCRDMLPEHISLAQTSTPYEEAESAAAFIQGLVRDGGYRYGEIAVLCNDMDGRGRTLRRAFERWDIPAFADQKRRVLHQPVVSFLLSFLDALTSGLRGDGLIGMIKSGLLGWEAEEEALLENYVREFHIRGSRWKKEFVWDGGRYEDDLPRLNEMREFLVSVCERAGDSIGRRNTAGEKIAGLIGFLEDDFGIEERIGIAVERQQKLQIPEGAAETAQIWNAICGIFEQIVRVIGDEKISNVLLREMIEAGLETLEIGLVPVSSDCVIIGTLQRSRPGRIRALVVTGANAGLLPLDAPEEGLLTRREKERLEQMELEFAGRQRVAQMEEQLAIYRMFSLPEEHLYVSCSQSGEDGSMLRPSEVFLKLQRWQPETSVDLNARPLPEQIGSAKATLPYLAGALRAGMLEGDQQLTPEWDQVMEWYKENDPRQADRVLRGSTFDNTREALGKEMADALYRGDRQMILASASRLEKFSGCPFAHFIQYGLRAQEQREFEVGGREIGDVYHQCMMEFSRELEMAALQEREGVAGAAGLEAPTWDTITEEECRERISRILREGAKDYMEGLFSADGYSEFRMERINEICGDIAWALVNQVRKGQIERMYFEEPFGQQRRDGGAGAAGTAAGVGAAAGAAEAMGASIPPVDIEVDGRKVRIRGIIDRLDVLDAGDGNKAIRIVDYKTGNNTIRTEDFESGYKLQLMVYMDAALHGSYDGSDGPAEPAGVFYFKIRDFSIDGDDSAGIPDPEDPGDLERRMRKFYRMEGVVINDPARIGAMDASVDGTDNAESFVIPVKYTPKKECFEKTAGGTLLETEEFQHLLEATNQQVERICGELVRGEIDARPKREKKKDQDGNRFTACKYCDYRSICRFDTALPGCRYEDV